MKIEILYPEVANLYGESANVKYLKKCLPHANFIETTLNDKPQFIFLLFSSSIYFPNISQELPVASIN